MRDGRVRSLEQVLRRERTEDFDRCIRGVARRSLGAARRWVLDDMAGTGTGRTLSIGATRGRRRLGSRVAELDRSHADRSDMPSGTSRRTVPYLARARALTTNSADPERRHGCVLRGVLAPNGGFEPDALKRASLTSGLSGRRPRSRMRSPCTAYAQCHRRSASTSELTRFDSASCCWRTAGRAEAHARVLKVALALEPHDLATCLVPAGPGGGNALGNRERSAVTRCCMALDIAHLIFDQAQRLLLELMRDSKTASNQTRNNGTNHDNQRRQTNSLSQQRNPGTAREFSPGNAADGLRGRGRQGHCRSGRRSSSTCSITLLDRRTLSDHRACRVPPRLCSCGRSPRRSASHSSASSSRRI